MKVGLQVCVGLRHENLRHLEDISRLQHIHKIFVHANHSDCPESLNGLGEKVVYRKDPYVSSTGLFHIGEVRSRGVNLFLDEYRGLDVLWVVDDDRLELYGDIPFILFSKFLKLGNFLGNIGADRKESGVSFKVNPNMFTCTRNGFLFNLKDYDVDLIPKIFDSSMWDLVQGEDLYIQIQVSRLLRQLPVFCYTNSKYGNPEDGKGLSSLMGYENTFEKMKDLEERYPSKVAWTKYAEFFETPFSGKLNAEIYDDLREC